MVRVASNCFVYEAQFAECEGLSEEVVGVRCSCVALAKVIDGTFDDVCVVIRQRSGCGDRGEADVLAGVQCVRDLLVGDDVDVGDGEHPAAFVPGGVVEDVQWEGRATVDAGLVT